MAQIKKRNNHWLKNKARLRADFSPDSANVLDCFSGEGFVWAAAQKMSGKRVRRIGIDRIDYGVGFFAIGDNLAFLKEADLTRYNVIDLDAYGVPYEQMKLIFEKGWRGRIFGTFIQTVYGRLPYGMIEEIGFSRAMIERTPSIFGKNGWNFFLEWLANNGVREIIHLSDHRKHYFTFEINDVG